MLSSFADLVALNPHPFVRPVISQDGGPMVIKGGRHPVIASLPQQQLCSSFVPNDLFFTALDNMHIVSGPNGAGKVTHTLTYIHTYIHRHRYIYLLYYVPT